MKAFDVVVLGAGAAGMMCAAVAGQRGLQVALLDHATRLAEKIRISGGGRCNFTNLETVPERFLSQNPAFCRSALARYTPRDFLALVAQYRIGWHEKHRGQLFCDDSSERIIGMLQSECDKGSVRWFMGCQVEAVRSATVPGSASGALANAAGFELDTSAGLLRARQVVVATGGMAIPQLGATDFGLRLARQFGLKIIEPKPALVPLTFDSEAWQPFAQLAGVAAEVTIETGSGKDRGRFREDLLFTHKGLSGPAVLQISSYWTPGSSIRIDLAPEGDVAQTLLTAKHGSRQNLDTVLGGVVPRRLAAAWLSVHDMEGAVRLADVPDKQLRALANNLHQWNLVPRGTAGFRKAEVMRGGVDTRELHQQTMQSRKAPGLYFVGEAVDVTGWLGGYNFQWAWASGVACGKALTARVADHQ